ncbi:MAG: hypothetical protein AAF403_06300, partial [Pseudomonadota bacterium]
LAIDQHSYQDIDALIKLAFKNKIIKSVIMSNPKQQIYQAYLNGEHSHCDCLAFLGRIGEEEKKTTQAIFYYREALQANPNHILALNNLANLLKQKENTIDESIRLIEKALSIEPYNVVLLSNLSHIARRAKKIDFALRWFEKALAQLKDNLTVRHQYGILLASIGNLNEHDGKVLSRGIREFSINWSLHVAAMAEQEGMAKWEGENKPRSVITLAGILGFGDILQWLRYVPVLKKQFIAVIAWFNRPMIPLLEKTGLFARIALIDEPCPKADFLSEFSYLPAIFSAQSIFPLPYHQFNLEKQKIADWSNFLSHLSKPHIGISWAASRNSKSGHLRTPPLKMIEAITALVPHQLISLQVGDDALDKISKEDFSFMHSKIFDLSNAIKDYYDTACLIASLDLVISVDTSVAHLAASLGKEVWLILPEPTEWRWYGDSNKSRWYPTIRIFRQPQMGDWGGLFYEIAEVLVKYLNVKKHHKTQYRSL